MRQSLITAEVVRLTTRTILTLILLTIPSRALAGAGHDHGSSQFQQGDAGSVQNIEVDAATAKRLELKIEPAIRQQLSFGISTSGQIESLPNKQVDVTTPVGGTVTRLLVNPGDAVTAGQAVAMMTSPELASLRTESLDRQAEAIAAMQQAEADFKLAQQNLEQQRKIVTANIRQAKTEESFAQERYSKDQELLARGAIPRRTMLESEVKLQEAKAALAKAESALEVSEAQAQLYRAQSAVSVAQKRVKLSSQTYQTRLQQLGATPNSDGAIIIKAPISGIVANRETTLGESGQDAGKRIMTIVNGNDVQVSANIFEKDIDQVQIGQRVRVRANGLPDQTFEGRVNVIGAVVSGDTRIVPVKATLKNGNGVLKPGMFVELEILTDRTSTGVLAIPKSALVETNDRRQVVFVQNGNAFQLTEVELGRESGEFVEVKKGLFDGDLIVTQRANQLYAQSLRGGNVAADDHSEGEDKGEIASSTATAWLPWWLIVPVGGIIVGGAFWTGSLWSSRRSRLTLVNDSLYNNRGDGTEIYLDHAKPTIEPQPEEPLTNPRQSD
ncbi:efflux RND transporter periplasmic adaptor subunit [Aphanothece hegewaldii CCALA 016]|uniref:Efflux RND transporter periplasmic adaptor subunit n=1 Tax=Aphanothece hegewaldii CCALA 016 TaxID=2107694 RepID=A0A2T1LSG0_9CHRO|nr:efflux RND transporter periplasmic adaptor subunit [Aphanothece hegewaldii]PSF32922.1 efflux RND transporter periplasmic adaptor subunit [Aphanothece hegewaldii CCALA 016]